MSPEMDQCINPDQSLAELYRLQASYKRSLKMGFSDDEINQSLDNAETKKGECYL